MLLALAAVGAKIQTDRQPSFLDARRGQGTQELGLEGKSRQTLISGFFLCDAGWES